MTEEKQKNKPLKSDFIRMFSALEAAEKDAFEKYIVYFYGQYKSVLDTFELVSKAVKNKDENSLFSFINNEKKMLNNLSDLKKWLIEFITVQEIKNNSFEAKFLTLEALRKRKMKDVLAKKTLDLRTELARDKSLNNWQSLMTLGLDHAAYFNTENDKLATDLKADLAQLIASLDHFYIVHKLKYSTEQQNRTDILKDEQREPNLLPEILSLIAFETSSESVIHKLYLPLYQLAKDKSETAYFAIKDFLSSKKTLNSVEKLSILLSLLNFAAHQFRNGKKHYLDEYFQLVEIGLDQNLFTAAGYFPSRTFNNIVNVGSYSEKYDWTSDFIDNYSAFLNPAEKIIVYNLALARLNFGQKKFNAVIELLRQLESYKNVHFAIEIRTLLTRSYYEKGVDSFPKNHCQTFEQYLRRAENLNDDFKKSALNFVKIVHLLINTLKSKKEILDELNSLSNLGAVMYADWLKIKIEAREK